MKLKYGEPQLIPGTTGKKIFTDAKEAQAFQQQLVTFSKQKQPLHIQAWAVEDFVARGHRFKFEWRPSAGAYPFFGIMDELMLMKGMP